MKRKLFLPMLCLVALALTACKNGIGSTSSKNVFPENYTISGVNVGGMSTEEATEAIKTAVANYSPIVTINAYEVTLTADALGLSYDESTDMKAALKAAHTEEESDDIKTAVTTSLAEEDATKLLTTAYREALNERVSTEVQTAEEGEEAESSQTADQAENTEKSEAAIALELATASNNAYIQYDADQHAFVAKNGKDCDVLDYTDATASFLSNLKNLATAINLETTTVSAEGQKAKGNEKLAEGLKAANAYLDLELSVYFSPEGYIPVTETFDKDTIASWFKTDIDDYCVEISEDALSESCSNLASEHNRYRSVDRTFHTTASGDITISAPDSGIKVEPGPLYEGFLEAINNQKSVTLDAVYSEIESVSEDGAYDFDGNYVEIDVTNQHVYVYKDYQLMVDSDVVTGCVVNGGITPPGVYQIFTHDKDRYLNGPTWHVWVNYFCAFNGGMGFHDTTYRSAFGGDIYIYGGSHGCVNMPLEAAEALYNNVEIGTYVVCYGGVQYVDKLTQTWTGTASYTKTEGDKKFSLDASFTGDTAAAVTYKSSNKKVATVSQDGVVTVKKAGTATITISTAETDKYAASKFEVTITVNAKPQEEEPESETESEKKVTLKNAKITASNQEFTVEPGQTANIVASTNSNGALSYALESTTSDLVSVSSKGVITVSDSFVPEEGGSEVTLKVTIKSKKTSTYKAASKTITVTVHIENPTTP